MCWVNTTNNLAQHIVCIDVRLVRKEERLCLHEAVKLIKELFHVPCRSVSQKMGEKKQHMNSKMPHLTVTLFQTQPSLWLQSPQPQKSTADVAPLHGLQHQDLHHKQERETRHTHTKKKRLRNKLVERIWTDFVLSASCLFVSRMECRLSTIPVNLCICQPHSTCHNSLSLSLSLFLPPQKEKSNKHSHLSAVLSQQACQRQWHSPCGRGRTPPSTRCCCCSRVQPSASPAPQAAVVPGPHGTAAQCTRAARPPRSVRLRCPVMASSLAPSFSSSPSITHSQRGKK